MKTAILVSIPVDQGLREEIRSGLSPNRDFLALGDALDATLITPARVSPAGRSQASKLLESFKTAWAAFRQRHQYDLIITDVDRVGVALALLFKLAGVRKRHILISHGNLTHHKERRFVKLFRLQRYIDRFVCYSPLVAQKLTAVHGLSPHRVLAVRHPADHRFWHPLPVTPEKLICTAGLFHRDYRTLIKAVRGLDVSLISAASSPWLSTQKNGIWGASLPQNVRFTPNPPKDTDGRREGSGRWWVRELQGRWPGVLG